MMPSILLLDCSNILTSKLKRQGFDVDAGNVGFCTGTRYLPCQLYEKNILIYNPSLVTSRRDGSGYISAGQVQNSTPEYGLTSLKQHILRGATILVFINHVAAVIGAQSGAYSWIPFMPNMHFTKDHKIYAFPVSSNDRYKCLAPIISPVYIKKPVLQKLKPAIGEGGNPLFFNMNNEILGTIIERGKGKIIILPQCQSNEDIISTFLHRVIPKLYDLKVRTNIIDEFVSTEEEKAQNEVKEIEEKIFKLNQAIEGSTEKLNSAKRNKIQTVKGDETATLVLNYYNLAKQQDDVALFYLYKVTEALGKKCGGEKEAKKNLDCNVEWNLIGKLANASYADVRHAPKTGEKIKEWTPDEIEKCFKAAEKIICAYLATLFRV